MWSNRNVWIMLVGEFIAGLGMWITIIANLEFIQQQIPSDLMKSFVLVCGWMLLPIDRNVLPDTYSTRDAWSILLVPRDAGAGIDEACAL